jgi:hypothetical protein
LLAAAEEAIRKVSDNCVLALHCLQLAHLVGPYENPLDQHHDVDLPFCIQAYIIPMRDLRYIATYGGPDKGTCTVFARRFSARYTHATDDTLSYADLVSAPSVQRDDWCSSKLVGDEASWSGWDQPSKAG